MFPKKILTRGTFVCEIDDISCCQSRPQIGHCCACCKVLKIARPAASKITDSRAALSEHTLNNLVRIGMEGPPLEEFDPTPAIQLWVSSANRRPNQRARKQYNSRDSAKRPKVLIEQDDSSPEESYDTDDNEENELIKELEDLE